MNAKDLQEALGDIMSAKLVPMLAGSPGIGKSDIIRQVAQQFRLLVIDLRLSQCDPTDLCGFPIHDGKRMTYAPPAHFPLQGIDQIPAGYDGWLLFLDEASSAALAVQAAAYKLVLDRMVGLHHLHKNVAIVLAGNKSTDGAIVNRMSTAMQSRLIHLELEVDAKLWIEWATANNIDHRIVSYIEGRPEHLHQFDPNHNDVTFSCPRTWQFASKLILGKDVTPRILPLLIGTLSAGIAHEFNAYLQYCSALPSIADIKRNPTGIDINQDPALLYAVSHMVAAYIDETGADALMKYIARLPLEFGTTAIRATLKRNKELLKVPAVRDWSHQVASEIF
jgi:hypothetical protein